MARETCTVDDVLETRGKFRAVIHPDMDPQPPDGDYFGYVFYLDRWGCQRMGKGYTTPDEDFSLKYLWDRWQDMGLIERYLRIFCDVVGFDYFDTQEGKFINIVTRADLSLWGWNTEDPSRWPYEDPAQHNLKEWRAYYEGDVWFYTIEKRVTWTTDDEDVDPDTREDWEQLDSCGGYFGSDQITEGALEALGNYAPKEDA